MIEIPTKDVFLSKTLSKCTALSALCVKPPKWTGPSNLRERERENEREKMKKKERELELESGLGLELVLGLQLDS
jgi:hypothetical protein